MINKIQYEIREAQMSDAEAIAHVHLITWKVSYKGIIEHSYLDQLTFANRLDLRKKVLAENAGIHLIATFNDNIIGFYDAGRLLFHDNQKVSEKQSKQRNEEGEIYALYILPEHQHLGVGRVLFQAGTNKLKEKHLTPFIAWVLKENYPAIKFYESMGGKLVDEIAVMIGDKEYREIAYQFN